MALHDDALSIDTPENVIFQYKVAGIGSRFIAAVIDTLLIVLLQVLGTIAFTLLATLFVPGNDVADDIFSFSSWIVAAAGIIMFVFFWGYYILFEGFWNGQTPGKRLVKLRVIRSDGSPLSFSEAVIRNLVRLIDFMPLYYGVGVIVMFLNDRSRRLGDIAAGTLVVHERGALTLASLEQSSTLAAPLTPTLQADLAVERLSPADIDAAEEFINRRSELYNRDALALRIGQTLAERMDEPAPPDSLAAQALIQRVVQAARVRQK
jgi:uncharacterized RDD family membrane protein YckC